MDSTRNKIEKLLRASEYDLKAASMALGKNAAYLQQYLNRGTPKVLPEAVRRDLARLLKVPESEIGGTGNEPPPLPQLPEDPAEAALLITEYVLQHSDRAVDPSEKLQIVRDFRKLIEKSRNG
jgi:hypothetical protein